MDLNNLAIRELKLTDAKLILDVFRSDEKIMSRQGTVRCLCEAEEYIKRFTDPAKAYTEVLYNPLTFEKKPEILAAVTLQFDHKNRSAFVSYWVKCEYRNKGLASFLVSNLCDRAFCLFNLDRLELMYRLNNPASAVVAKRASFTIEGIERQKLIMDGKRIDVAICGRLKDDK